MKRFFRKRIFEGWSQPNGMTYLLLPFTALYRCLLWIRRCCYQAGIFSRYRARVPVIVVGNISVGGTGKTPLTIALAKQLIQRGFRPGVISRGYGGSALEWPQLVDAQSNPHYMGDEPVLFARREICPIVVGPDRSKAIELLLSHHDCDIVLSDDGLQHYAMQRDIEISVVDVQRRHLNLFCLPAGPLREPVSRLKTVDLVILHAGQSIEPDAELLTKLGMDVERKPMRSALSMMHLEQKPLKGLLHQGSVPAGAVVHAVAGIGHPQRFFNALRATGFEVIEHPFEDHHQFVAEDFVFADDLPIVMTEKDAVKCESFATEKFYYMPVEARLNAAAMSAFDTLLDSVISEDTDD